ncbi:hypothetical protein V9K67_15950 [Paraflavisolibacter sp. H34]|uniref:hypothetical protein n=1 Tax=Huijunlia imazamoxiresistens TaxID=3127457 RepID=UPI003018DC99
MERVRIATPGKEERKREQKLRYNIEFYATKNTGSITHRIKELNKEWDVERVLEVHLPLVALTGLALSAVVDKRWLALPALVLGFFLEHAVHGWCPPLPLLRKLGFRTRKEIEQERYAMKLLRGDFDDLDSSRKGKSNVVVKALEK